MRQFVRQLRDLNLARLWLGFLTAWFFVVISGLPLPMLREVIQDSDLAISSSDHSSIIHKAEKDRSKPFPCMFSSCGCNTAEQCWRQCCCHDLKSKLAWAKRNHVTPPDYVIAEARQKGLLSKNESLAVFSSQSQEGLNKSATVAANTYDKTKPACPHCAAKNKSTNSCCTERKTCCAPKSSCCDSENASDIEPTKTHSYCSKKSPESSNVEVKELSSASSVIVIQALHCRGESLNLLGFAPMLPVVQIHVSAPENLLVERLVVSSDQVSMLVLDVLTPPPWV